MSGIGSVNSQNVIINSSPPKNISKDSINTKEAPKQEKNEVLTPEDKSVIMKELKNISKDDINKLPDSIADKFKNPPEKKIDTKILKENIEQAKDVLKKEEGGCWNPNKNKEKHEQIEVLKSKIEHIGEPKNENSTDPLKELNSKGEVYIKDKDYGGDTNSTIQKLFPGAKISPSVDNWPNVTTKFTDKDGHQYEATRLVHGFAPSDGITITKIK